MDIYENTVRAASSCFELPRSGHQSPVQLAEALTSAEFPVAQRRGDRARWMEGRVRARPRGFEHPRDPRDASWGSRKPLIPVSQGM